MQTVSQTLVDWTWSTDGPRIPAEVREAVREHALDGLGNAFAASRLGQAAYAAKVAEMLGGSGEASVVGAGRVGAASAAFANGVLIHALDYDDTHPEALVHPTAVVIPTALAIGEREHLPGREVLAAAVAGYEVVIRLGAALRHGFHARGFHATSVCGVFASALVAAKLLGLPRQQAVAALGIAGSFASGSLEFLSDGSATKQVHPGWASHGGIIAAFLAAAGASGPATIIEGDAGLFNLFAGSGVDTTAITRGLGKEWLLTRTQIKPYPFCQLSVASIDALKLVRPRLRDLSEIQRITIDIPTESVPIVCEPLQAKLQPRSSYDAKFSLQWCAAAFLVDGRIGVDTFDPMRLARPEVLELATKVDCRAYHSDVAAASAPGRVEVETREGAQRAEAPATKAASPEMIDEKLALNVGDDAVAADLARLVRGIEGEPTLDSLARAMRGRPAPVAP
jgi:2-methylcitrate dehydratase PrpD